MKTFHPNCYFYLALVIIVIFNLLSCSPEYTPNMANVPMFDRKGELQANLAGGFSGTDVQLAYAFADNFGVMANGSFYDETSDTTDEFHKHSLYEFGVGYFDNIGKSGRYEVFGGFGTGRIKGYKESRIDDPVGESNFFKIFIQPAVGLKSTILDGSLGTRWVMVRTDYTEGDIEAQSRFLPFFEPVLTGRLGFKYVKIVSQIGFSVPVKDVSFDYQPFILNIGLHLNVNVLGN